jgi:hypothetical protein
MKLFSYSICVLMLASAGLAHSAKRITNPSKYRKVKGLTGNCVFSATSLGFKQENKYRLMRKVKGPAEVYARCYWGQQMKWYKNVGKISQHNSLMSRSPRYYVNLKIGDAYYEKHMTYDSKIADRDQGAIWLTNKAPDCDFKDSADKKKCLIIDTEVRELAKMQKASLPFTTEVCLTTEVKFADREKMTGVKKGVIVRKPVYKRQLVSKGCFKYTAR